MRRAIRLCAAVCGVWLTSSTIQAEPVALAMARLPADSHTVVAQGTERVCQVTSVHDGDSMRMRCPGFRRTLPIRLDQVDAPELDQAYGIKSRDHLRSLCPVGKQARVWDLGPDTYNRRLGRVFCDGRDVNAAMIESGSAWVYEHYANDRNLQRLQKKAQSEKRGLWAGPKKPVAPWTFRYQQRRSDQQ